MVFNKRILALLPLAVASTSAALQTATAFTANPNIGPGGQSYVDSDHFRLYSSTTSDANTVLSMLEVAYNCFVDDLEYTSTAISYNAESTNGVTLYKENIYPVDNLGSAAGVLKTDPDAGLSWLEMIPSSLADPRVTVHEYGHALTYHSRTWVDQTATGSWSKHNQATGDSMIELNKVIGDSFQVIVDATTGIGNYYQAWPFFTYITSNPDNYKGLGSDTVRQLFLQYRKGSNETPLHTLARASTSASVPEIVGRYWARMAYLDIGHSVAQTAFFEQRSNFNYANVDAQGNGVYVVKSARKPQYMGANIIPLKTSGVSNVQVSITCQGEYSATLAIRSTESGVVRYVQLENGRGSASVAGNEEASLVIANTPSTLYQYDGFKLSDEVRQGLDYSVQISGATA